MQGRVLSLCKQEKRQQMLCQFVGGSGCAGLTGLSAGFLQTQMALGQTFKAVIEGKMLSFIISNRLHFRSAVLFTSYLDVMRDCCVYQGVSALSADQSHSKQQ